VTCHCPASGWRLCGRRLRGGPALARLLWKGVELVQSEAMPLFCQTLPCAPSEVTG
jgi:hypothetical protein